VTHFCERYRREGWKERKKTAGRPTTKLLDWLIQKTENRTYEYWHWTEDDGGLGTSDQS